MTSDTRDRSIGAALLFGCGLLTMACTGTIESLESTGANRGGTGPGAGGGQSGSRNLLPDNTGGSASACKPPQEGARLRRLTQVQYRNTIADLVGITGRGADFENDSQSSGGFFANSQSPATRLSIDAYADSAVAIAAASDLTKLVSCPLATGTEDCARKFIESFGRKAFRRPLTSDDTSGLLTLFRIKRGRSDFASSIRLVLSAMLQAPSFMYRPTVAVQGAAPSPAALYSLASELSFFIWSTTPDDELLNAADAGDLATPAGVEKQVRRLLDSPRALDSLESFHEQWMGLTRIAAVSKNSDIHPEFTADMRTSMLEEHRRFTRHVFTEGDGSLETLLLAPYAIVDARLATHYGITKGAPTTGFARMDLPANQRSGLLTQAGFLAVQSLPDQPSPIHRGKFVRTRLLCQDVPPPPDGVDIAIPKVDPTLPTKARFEAHRKDPSCANCHALMDPIGFGFQHYDATGRWRERDGNFAVDAKGEISDTDSIDGPFDGVLELNQKLLASNQVHACVGRQWVRYALGRHETDDETCFIDSLQKRFDGANMDVRELLLAIATSDTFRNQTIVDEAVTK
jgi:Protein of unknown function (DUF1592)/Protein of unknown function (DUF1588)/Protein of unknown function (DUF1595)/Protein of unknown function (DUF1585)/Protein of unknown function (DUF1587)